MTYFLAIPTTTEEFATSWGALLYSLRTEVFVLVLSDIYHDCVLLAIILISALVTDNNRLATNAPDMITISVGSLITKSYAIKI